MKFGVLGDVHGDHRSTVRAMKYFADNGVTKVVQVGDFGIFPLYYETTKFLSELEINGKSLDVTIYAVRGNHDDDKEFDRVVSNSTDEFGFGIVSDHVRLAPRAHTWAWDGKSFAQLGGAASIDRAIRTPGYDWFPGERITDEDIDSLPTKKIDYFFTHDASDHTSWGFELIPLLESELSRKQIDKALNKLRPTFHFHGHYHRKYEWLRHYWDSDEYTHTFGLECNGMWDYYGIMDTETERFEWRTMK